jgi:hypothetical protein
MLLADDIIEPLWPETVGQRPGRLRFEESGQGYTLPL